MNKFEEDLENCPFSSDWDEQRKNIIGVILSYKEQMDYFKEFRSHGEDFIHLLIFSIFDSVYLYNQSWENGLIESAQLEKIIDFDNDIAFVLYSNVENSPSCFPYVKKALSQKYFFYEINSFK